MEEAQSKQKLPVLDRPLAAQELDLRHLMVQTLHVGLHALEGGREGERERERERETVFVCLCAHVTDGCDYGIV